MNCVNHADIQAAAFCIRCGRALCQECTHHVRGAVYCEACLAEIVQEKGSAAPPPPGAAASRPQSVAGTNPGVAFALGLIPGVGAIYNGEFLKAAIHVLIFGVLASLNDGPGIRSGQPLIGMAMAAFFFYMAFEAYYTAKKRKLALEGVQLDTPIDRLHQQFGDMKDKELWGGVALVVIGGLFLADNFDLVRFERISQLFWPAVLIGLGIWMLKRHQEGTR
jgi:hypothetical protein